LADFRHPNREITTTTTTTTQTTTTNAKKDDSESEEVEKDQKQISLKKTNSTITTTTTKTKKETIIADGELQEPRAKKQKKTNNLNESTEIDLEKVKEESEHSDTSLPVCIYGASCYRNSEQHRKEFWHPKK